MVHELLAVFSGLHFQDSCCVFSFRALEVVQKKFGQTDERTRPTDLFGGNRDDGDLVDIRRFYVQDGKVIPNSNVSIAGVHGNSITDKAGNQVFPRSI